MLHALPRTITHLTVTPDICITLVCPALLPSAHFVAYYADSAVLFPLTPCPLPPARIRIPGTEPAVLRSALASALPDAPGPEAQMVREPAMLHTTLARLLAPPQGAGGAGAGGGVDGERVVAAVAAMSEALCGLRATFRCSQGCDA